MTLSVLAIDLAKHVFQLHGVDGSGAGVLSAPAFGEERMKAAAMA